MFIPPDEENMGEYILKRVTLRGIDSDLYDQAASIAKRLGFSMGEFFSFIFRFISQGERFPPFIRFLNPFHHLKHQPKTAIIENRDTLDITKEDLIAVGNTRFAFFNITNLSFGPDVDSETLLNHVIHIARCKNVTFFNENIPKLIKYGLVRQKVTYDPNSAELRDITIRNVSRKDYHDFLGEVKKENITVGEKLNPYLANIIPRFEIHSILVDLNEPEALVLLNLDVLNVTRKGLEELGRRKVLFYGVKKLTFDYDIPPELFQDKVIQIRNCKNVTKPANLPRLIWYALLKN
ncbi:MAG: hypothetical protein EAX86_04280 [Candidatus Heimdallarchaeota archaeon]|nr:hypothetical protein [Candidatus Heimdallarchaeota archaeon]